MKQLITSKIPKLFYAIIFIFINFSSIGQIDCNTPNRYREDVLTILDIDTFSVVYANYTSSQLWNNGDTLSGSNCFDPRNHLSVLPDGTWDIHMKVYSPKLSVDQCQSRAAIVYVHGGGYAYLATGIESPNVAGVAVAMALKGYVVVTLDYRKGWDIREAKNVTGLGPLLPGCQNCPCEGGNSNCDPFTFTKMNYMMMQDTRAAHRKLLTFKDSIHIDEDKIFYMSSSTGSVGAMHAAFAADDFGQFQSPNGTPIDQILGQPDAIGVPVPAGANFSIAGIAMHAGAIHNMDWIENSDDVPLCMVHGTVDEAVLYCAGNILQMKYFTTNSSNYLSLQGPGKIYKTMHCNSDGMPTKSKVRLHSFQGLYHNLCSPLGSTDPTDNCDTLNTESKLFGFFARFCADVIQTGGIDNQHMFAANSSSQNLCNVSDSNYWTPCTNFNPCNLSVEELNQQSVFIYPSLVAQGEYLFFDHDFNDEMDRIKIYDAYGKIVLDQTDDLADRKIRITFPTGIYYLNFIFNKTIYTKKMVVH